MYVDYSYYDILSVRDLLLTDDEQHRRKPLNANEKKIKPPSNSPCGLRLCSNRLTTAEGILDLVKSVLWSPLHLRCLDLSSNNITSLPGELFTQPLPCPRLSTVYLHDNNLPSIPALFPLKTLPELRVLTAYANPLSGVRLPDETGSKTPTSGTNNDTTTRLPSYASALPKQEPKPPAPRGAYRMSVLRLFPTLRSLDWVEVIPSERAEANRLAARHRNKHGG